jgi:hypothetical protein
MSVSSTMFIMFLLAVGVAAVAGCSKQYQPAGVSVDSPPGQAVQAMLAQLRAATGQELQDVLARQIADGLDEGRLARLRASLETLAASDQAKLDKITQFGADLYRCTFSYEAGGRPGAITILVLAAQDQYRWAGQSERTPRPSAAAE